MNRDLREADFWDRNYFRIARDSGVIEVIMVLGVRMAQPHFLANREIEMVFLALQVFQVLFLWVHDWIPLGHLNDVAAVRSQDTRHRLVTVTLIQSVPWTIGLCFSLWCFRRPYPDWLYDWLVISYGLLFVGQIRAAQWNGPKHRAYPASFGDRRHLDRSSHEVRTAIGPRSKLPLGRQTLP